MSDRLWAGGKKMIIGLGVCCDVWMVMNYWVVYPGLSIIKMSVNRYGIDRDGTVVCGECRTRRAASVMG